MRDFHYKSFSDLNSAIIRNLHKFPHDIDIVVGIPRSGMLPANLLALYLNKPFTDIDSFVEGRVYSHGNRQFSQESAMNKRVLIVDDSIFLGNALLKAKEKLQRVRGDNTYCYAVVYTTESSRGMVDVFCEVVPPPRFFQWNVFHHPGVIPFACFDIDGVLCENPPVDDDGPIYMDYIANAEPKFIPSYEIDMIVSCRLEKYRNITENWLHKNNVKYRSLVMLDMATREERKAWGKHGFFKGSIYKNNSKASLFVESSYSEAKQIAKTSGKPVFCVETFSLLEHKDVRSFIHDILVLLWRLKMKLKGN